MMDAPYIPITDALLRDWPLPSLAGSEGKEDRGRLVVVGGSRSIPGAVRLAAEAGLRAGAGKLHVMTAASVQAALAVAVPEAKVSSIPENSRGSLRYLSRDLIHELARADSVLVGPGMETCSQNARVVRQISESAPVPIVLDAGALDGVSACASLGGSRVVTPHFGEMARLMGVPLDEIRDKPAAVARLLARQARCTVVLKSPTTYVANPQGQCWIHAEGSVGLGTSGSGDVLAGLVTGLLARGATLDQAAVWGVRLHGKAGEVLTAAYGPVGFLARQISREVPLLMSKLTVQ
ncbi:MAG: NAD(P)H-hydrate dehydratase [Alphaproteobacteria bacterium]|nr:MAG: NAD(P)H-hydrate dehydratase [Alphaproteobacteria bacterium]